MTFFGNDETKASAEAQMAYRFTKGLLCTRVHITLLRNCTQRVFLASASNLQFLGKIMHPLRNMLEFEYAAFFGNRDSGAKLLVSVL